MCKDPWSTANKIDTTATLFAGEGRAVNSTPTVNESVEFHFVIDGKVRTLSSQNTSDEGGTITGLFFVPTLDKKDPCNEATARYVPSNVTRQEDVADYGYKLIGLAPWISVNCTQAYFAAARAADAGAMVVYRPTDNQTKKPPIPQSNSWNLDDKGLWRSQNHYPVYAIPGPSGNYLMDQLALYSGNKTLDSIYGNASHANSTNISPFGQLGDIRLFTMIYLQPASTVFWPTWLVVLVIFVVITIFVVWWLVHCRHWFQQEELLTNRRGRELVRQENFERHRMRRLREQKVPREILESLPLYKYPDLAVPQQAILAEECRSKALLHEDKTTDPAPKRSTFAFWREINGPNSEDLILPAPSTVTTRGAGLSAEGELKEEPKGCQPWKTQTTCAICLDEFTAGESMVRELPCNHIFHSACIDRFLMQRGNFCPLCKKSVLPEGYYPHLPAVLPMQPPPMQNTSRFSVF
ncbi:hypothetical protein ASPZODRAFT_15225 [Penicilliopsis zonata CBS 506.65]|uniref:RING-type domain-containing protein n=1 Tax=Penicilliopsis zonata CBS 506.65 TaxID=1073090 RepID=A0A1L9SKM5_9EURO|nr:hypothetical protein ASPZODRAFT_15225 [Penicilliopsis zonata CBS 506.65]OJJ47779.1 hypothetical protein ASPZODRAFT_15225 [Penicilliopsis zonata CBS 506.65]